MKYLVSDELDAFECIGSACPDTCCAGWTIQVDEETAKYYRSVKNEFGTYLNENLVERAGNTTMKLKEEGMRCAFLNDENLCRIYIELGRERLCRTCTQFPRIYMESGELLLASLTFSCPEVCRRILTRQAPLLFDYSEDKKKPKTKKMNKSEWDFFNTSVQVLTTGADILQERTLDIARRQVLFLLLCRSVQDCMDQKQPKKAKLVLDLFSNPQTAAQSVPAGHGSGDIALYLRIAEIYNRHLLKKSSKSDTGDFIRSALLYLEQILDNGDQQGLEKIQTCLHQLDGAEYQIQQEHILVSYCFRHFFERPEEKDIFAKAVMVVVFNRMYNFLCAAASAKEGALLSLDARIQILSRLSRTMEHNANMLGKAAETLRERGMLDLGTMFQLVY